MSLPKAQQVTQNYELRGESKAAQPNSLQSIMACKKVEEADSANNLVTDNPCPEVLDRRNYRDALHQRTQPAADVSQIKLEESRAVGNSAMTLHNLRNCSARNVQASLAEDEMNQLTRRYCNVFTPKHGTAEVKCHHLTCSQQVPHCSVLPRVNFCHNLV